MEIAAVTFRVVLFQQGRTRGRAGKVDDELEKMKAELETGSTKKEIEQ